MRNTDQRLSKASLINLALKADAKSRIRIDEQIFADQMESVTDLIIEHGDRSYANHTIIMLSGPSASGKTTTAGILQQRLTEKGFDAAVISLDNFYLHPDDLPLLPSGEPDYESIRALDVEAMHRCFIELIETGSCEIPKFDFRSDDRVKETIPICLKSGGVAIMEGIHALNPVLVEKLPADSLLKLYVSVSTPITDDDGNNLLSERALRLIRRMSRDLIYRNSSPVNTLKMWPGVIDGEEKYLFPYKNTADYTINTLHSYEPAVFKSRVLEMLKEIPANTPHYSHVEALEKGLGRFVTIEESLVPHNSLLREFLEQVPENRII